MSGSSGTEGTVRRVRAAIALRAAFQSIVWIAAEAGLFRRHGLEVTLTLETGGPRAASGTVKGDWEFCHTGDLPVVEGVLRRQDPVLILAPNEPHDAAFVMAKRDITSPEQLANARVGAVDAAGQFGRAVQNLLQKWQIQATLVSLGSFAAIYQALAKGEIDAGYLPVDLRFLGESEFGWNALAGIPVGAGGIVTTRRLIARDRALVAEFTSAIIDAIALFKVQPNLAIPLLQRFVQISDRKAVERLHAYYAPLFRADPRPTFFAEMPRLKAISRERFPIAEELLPEQLYDTSFVNELVQAGYIDRMYAK